MAHKTLHRAFNELLHPRDDRGRFTRKGTGSTKWVDKMVGKHDLNPGFTQDHAPKGRLPGGLLINTPARKQVAERVIESAGEHAGKVAGRSPGGSVVKRLDSSVAKPEHGGMSKPAYPVGHRVETLQHNFDKPGAPREWVGGTVEHVEPIGDPAKGRFDLRIKSDKGSHVHQIIGPRGGNTSIRHEASAPAASNIEALRKARSNKAKAEAYGALTTREKVQAAKEHPAEFLEGYAHHVYPKHVGKETGTSHNNDFNRDILLHSAGAIRRGQWTPEQAAQHIDQSAKLQLRVSQPKLREAAHLVGGRVSEADIARVEAAQAKKAAAKVETPKPELPSNDFADVAKELGNKEPAFNKQIRSEVAAKRAAAKQEKRAADLAESREPTDNGAKIKAIQDGTLPYADLYRTAAAGPSGQKAQLQVGRVRHTPDNPSGEFKIIDRNGTHVGWASHTVRNGEPTYVFHSEDSQGGQILEGWSSSLALGADVLTSGHHQATGYGLDSTRASGGTFERYQAPSLEEADRMAARRELANAREKLASGKLGPGMTAQYQKDVARLEGELGQARPAGESAAGKRAAEVAGPHGMVVKKTRGGWAVRGNEEDRKHLGGGYLFESKTKADAIDWMNTNGATRDAMQSGNIGQAADIQAARDARKTGERGLVDTRRVAPKDAKTIPGHGDAIRQMQAAQNVGEAQSVLAGHSTKDLQALAAHSGVELTKKKKGEMASELAHAIHAKYSQRAEFAPGSYSAHQQIYNITPEGKVKAGRARDVAGARRAMLDARQRDREAVARQAKRDALNSPEGRKGLTGATRPEIEDALRAAVKANPHSDNAAMRSTERDAHVRAALKALGVPQTDKPEEPRFQREYVDVKPGDVKPGDIVNGADGLGFTVAGVKRNDDGSVSLTGLGMGSLASRTVKSGEGNVSVWRPGVSDQNRAPLRPEENDLPIMAQRMLEPYEGQQRLDMAERMRASGGLPSRRPAPETAGRAPGGGIEGNVKPTDAAALTLERAYTMHGTDEAAWSARTKRDMEKLRKAAGITTTPKATANRPGRTPGGMANKVPTHNADGGNRLDKSLDSGDAGGMAGNTSRKATTTYTATHNGQTVTRKSVKPYTHASVVRYSSGDENIASFHTSEAAAARGVLTAQQRSNGAQVVKVVPVTAGGMNVADMSPARKLQRALEMHGTDESRWSPALKKQIAKLRQQAGGGLPKA